MLNRVRGIGLRRLYKDNFVRVQRKKNSLCLDYISRIVRQNSRQISSSKASNAEEAISKVHDAADRPRKIPQLLRLNELGDNAGARKIVRTVC